MTIPTLPSKDMFDVLPYSATFAEFLEAGDTIASAAIVVSPVGLGHTTPIISGSVVTTFLSSGVVDQTYEVSFEIVTANGWSVKRSGSVPVKDR